MSEMSKGVLHVTGMRIRDVRNVEFVDVDLCGKKWVVVSGNNGAGKSTLIDSIFMALSGPKNYGGSKLAWKVIHKDSDKAMVAATLGNDDRTLEVKRSITRRDDGGAGGSLVIKDSDGKRLTQEWLDSILTEFTVDPLGFARKPAKEQSRIFQELAGLDIEQMDRDRADAYEERKFANRRVKEMAAEAKAAECEPAERLSAGTLDSDLSAVAERNRARQGADADVRVAKAKAEASHAPIERAEREIADLERQLEEARQRKAALEEAAEGAKQALADCEKKRAALGREEDEEQIREKLRVLNDHNARADAYESYQRKVKALDEQRREAEAMDQKVKDLDRQRKEALSGSKLPFSNVEIDDDAGLMINGVAFSEMSDGEKIRVSTRIGMALNPELRLICVRDGAYLDEASLATLRELSKKYDYQVIVEVVGDQEGDDTIMMRDGRVSSAFAKVETVEEKAARVAEEL